MFTSLKKVDRGQMIELLKFIVNGTQSAAGGAVVPAAMASKLHKSEPTFIQYKSETPDAAGNVHVFATSAGVAAVQNGHSAAGGAALGATAPTEESFQLETGYEIPAKKAGGGLRGSKYPFESMQVGVSFFVAATQAIPNPAKGLASTVSSANRRFVAVYPATIGKNKRPHPKAGQPTGRDARSFTVRARTVADGEKANGARVWRVS